MVEPSTVGPWKHIAILGSGAFGVVSLWQNDTSDDSIAIKKCKFSTGNHLSERQKRRWENEVNIMKSLACPNIVTFKPLPAELETFLMKFNFTKLPLLSLEYCKKGNLRHILNLPKNSSGLEEEGVRTVLNDIVQGVSYLHKLKITHRDIKPENIVLQQCDKRPGGIIYKLIDLGYAKELNDSIVSFVGTLHYLAPEIMRTERYTYSVDYWSLGIVAFEVICGILPFLPHYTPMERFQYIERKKAEHICIYQLHSGSVSYSSELLKENHISTCLKGYLETWLRHVLQFNAVAREMLCPNDKNVFDSLLDVLRKKIVTVFSIHTLEFYSYEITTSTLVSTLKDWIARDIKVMKDDLILLTHLKMFDITDDKYVTNTLLHDDSRIYAFKKGVFINRESFTLPKCVKVLFENCTTSLRWRELRLIYVKSLFFLSQERKMLTAVIDSSNLYSTYLSHLNKKLHDSMHQIHKTLTNALVKIDCYYNLHNHKLNNLNMDNGPAYKESLLKFQQLLSTLDKCIRSTNILNRNVQVLEQREGILKQALSKVSPVVDHCDITTHIIHATDVLMKSGDNKEQNLSCKEMVKIVSSALRDKDKLLNNKNFQSYSKATSVAVRDVARLLESMAGFHNHVRELCKSVDDNQKEQYRILVASVKPKSDIVKMKTSSNFIFVDANCIIKENQELRCQFEDLLGQMFAEQRETINDIDILCLRKNI